MPMQKVKNIIFNITFALNILLLFLLIFDNRLQVPAWLQVVGRMHTMFLHFPIVMLALCIFWELFSGYKKSYIGVKAEIGDELLLAAAITSVITALMGLFLSREAGYTPDLLVWHKWGGVFISFLSLAWYVFRVKMRQIKPALLTTALAAMIMIIVTGHLGANITHGEDFLLAPVTPEKQKSIVLFEDAGVYANMVQPILEAKCISCHNAQKAKGELVMETKQLLLKGGKDGKLWDSTANDLGLLMERIHLPPQSKKHMPPQGKPQLTDEETEILYHWIKSGASFTTKVASLPERDSLRLLAAPLFQTIETDDYTFAPADEKKVNALNNNYRVVRALAIGSPALGVEFFSAEQFKPEQLKELLDVKNQIVKLNLNKMPVGDEDLKTIGQFVNLRKLNLSFTNITGATLHELAKLKELKLLSLSGTKIKSANLRVLATLPKLTQLFVWNTPLPPEEIKRLQQQLKTTAIESGYRGDTVVIKLNPPIIENEEQVITQPEELRLKHYINGVTIRYTTDGTEPDSLNSPVYKDGVLLDKKQTIKAKAYKPGWISSDVVEKIFYKAGVVPDSVQLVNAPDPQYKGEGASTLHDGKIGSLNFRDGMWLGYRVQPMAALFYFDKEVKASSVTISSIVDINSYLMPPQEIEVWGGSDRASLHLLKRLKPEQPTKEQPIYMTSYDVDFNPRELKVLKIILKPVSK
ncbi:MAG: chitobiase/beta-hexosaminidase C-terminal domain-containing protein, partial [Bacteroidota bacterium]|nr:chitobiase/beta-hexosaminidase C-terminal domain-containing protein [Bacteroidota bacterium]